MIEPILVKTLLTTVLSAGIQATAATATIPAASAYSTRSCPCVSRQKFLQMFFTFVMFLSQFDISIRVTKLKSVETLRRQNFVTHLQTTYGEAASQATTRFSLPERQCAIVAGTAPARWRRIGNRAAPACRRAAPPESLRNRWRGRQRARAPRQFCRLRDSGR